MTQDSLSVLQERRDRWGISTFGPDFFTRKEFAFRFLEEAIELAQALGLTPEDVIRQSRVVFSRPAGEAHQEIAGSMITLLALASHEGVSVSEVTLTELGRIEKPEVAAKILGRQAEKRANGLTDSSTVESDPLLEAVARIRDMLQGDDGQAWKEARKFLSKLEQKGIITGDETTSTLRTSS